MHRRTMIGGCLAAVAGWGSHARAQKADSSTKEKVAEAERRFADTMARRDFAAFPSYISEEAIFIGNGGTEPLRGRRAIATDWKQYFDGATPPFTWEPDLVELLESGRLALTTGPVRNPKGDLVGRFTSIWRLEADGQWRVVFDRGCAVCKCG